MDIGSAGLCLGPGWIRLDWIWVYMDSAWMGCGHGGLEFGWGATTVDGVWMGFMKWGAEKRGCLANEGLGFGGFRVLWGRLYDQRT